MTYWIHAAEVFFLCVIVFTIWFWIEERNQ